MARVPRAIGLRAGVDGWPGRGLVTINANEPIYNEVHNL